MIFPVIKENDRDYFMKSFSLCESFDILAFFSRKCPFSINSVFGLNEKFFTDGVHKKQSAVRIKR